MSEYAQKYNAEHYRRVVLDVPPKTKEELVKKAKAEGLSLTRYIVKTCLGQNMPK